MTRAWLLVVGTSVVIAAILSVVHSWIWGSGLSTWIAGISLVIGAMTSSFLSTRHPRRWIATFWLRADSADRLLFLILFLLGLFTMVTVSSDVAGQWQTSNPDNLADLPFHAHLINAFARGLRFPPANPIFSGEPLRYAFGIDLWDALWVRLGIPLNTSLIATGIAALLVTLIALWRTGGFLLTTAFFFSGGLAAQVNWEATFGPTSPLVWKNLFEAVFVTQRGFWWALPAGLEIMRKWMRYLDGDDDRLSKSFLFIWAVMPLFHLHSFVILSLWMGLSGMLQKKIPRALWLVAPIPALLILRSIDRGNVSSSLGWAWGWMFTGFANVFRNLGAWIVLPAWVIVKWARDRRWRDLVVAVIVTFFALNLKTAPWIWDQIKLLLWVYLLWTLWAVREFRWSGRMTVVLSLFLFWPGFLQWVSGWPSMTGRFEVQDAIERQVVRKLVADLAPDEVVAAQVDYRDPLYGSGQVLALGYPAAAWSHGLPSDRRAEQVDAILEGRSEGPRFLQELDVKWIVWRDNAKTPPPLETWSSWGWVEKKKEGTWHLWGQAR